jgi:heat shock protein HslJ
VKRTCAALVLLTFLLTGCTETVGTSDPAPSVTSQQLIGTWVPVNAVAIGSKSFAQFTVDGAWSGEDGCSNHTGGTWSISHGNFHQSAGATTLVGCLHKPPADLPNLFEHASRLVLTGDDRMTIFGEKNKVLGQVARKLTPLG